MENIINFSSKLSLYRHLVIRIWNRATNKRLRKVGLRREIGKREKIMGVFHGAGILSLKQTFKTSCVVSISVNVCSS